ncbi:hypothetical protein Ddye_024329 [Dipteronia dyeriana]|uniref:Uncharacterized protein n=1 Tax=Dipteronia dyeriana TaxID=168575 RepID=A0AAD9TUS8_9ROSI|nr:hypothetical protein Ddye_024329 [Dipteronia dyeriana]
MLLYITCFIIIIIIFYFIWSIFSHHTISYLFLFTFDSLFVFKPAIAKVSLRYSTLPLPSNFMYCSCSCNCSNLNLCFWGFPRCYFGHISIIDQGNYNSAFGLLLDIGNLIGFFISLYIFLLAVSGNSLSLIT